MEALLIFRSTGIDLGSTGTRKVSVGLFWGAPSLGDGGGRQTAVVPADVLTYRRVPLPPASRDVCRRVVQEELAYSLPFPLEQASWDFAGQAGSQALVVVAPQERLSGIQRLAGQANLDAEPLAYLRAALHCGVHNALIIDLGATKTTFCAILGEQVEWVRVMMRGGRSVTQRISEEMNLTLEQAEELKRRKGCELGACQTFVTELLDESMVGKSTPFEQVLLCGGAAAMPGLKSFLSLRLGIEPQTFPLPPPLSPYQHVSAFGAALSERPGQPRVRLLVGIAETTPGGLDPWVLLGISWALTMGLAVWDVETRHATLKMRHQLARNELVRSVQPWLPGADKMPAEAMVDKLKQNIQYRKNLKQQSVRYVADTVARMATVLREVPKAEIRHFVFEEGKVRLEGEVNSSQEAEQFRVKLVRVFPELQAVKVRSGAPGRFNYEFEGRMPSP